MIRNFKMSKVLIILTGGLLSDGISSAWYTLGRCMKDSIKTEVNIDFLAIEESSDQTIIEKYKKLGYNVISTPFRRSKPLIYIKNLTTILKENSYDIIHVNGSSSLLILEMIAAKLAHVRKRIVHSRNTTCGNIFLHKILFYPFNFLANFKMACGEDAGKWLFGKSDFVVFHNGIDLNKFKYDPETRNTIRSELNLLDGDLAIGHVGRFNFQKNHEFLIDIFVEIQKKKSNSKLFLFGDGQFFDKVKNKVKKYGLEDKVIFMGTRGEINKYLQAMDLMLLPSRYEGLPNVVVEWQAAGLPSIISSSITKECGVSSLVNYLALSNAPKLWAMKAIDLADYKINRNKESKKAIDALKESGFDVRMQADKLLDIYSS